MSELKFTKGPYCYPDEANERLDYLYAVCAELGAALKDALFGLEATETYLIVWNKTGSPCNVEYIRTRGNAALAHADSIAATEATNG